jgi:hypothetical protein
MLWRLLPLSKLLLGKLNQAEWLTIGCTSGIDYDSHIGLNMLNMNQITVDKIFLDDRLLQYLKSFHTITTLEVSMPSCFASRFKQMMMQYSFPHVTQLTACQRTIWLREKCLKLRDFTLRWREDKFLHWADNTDFQVLMQELKRGSAVHGIKLRAFWFAKDHKINSKFCCF